MLNTNCTVCQLPQTGANPTCNCHTQAETNTKIRTIGLFLLACITSPCCTPLLVPLLLSIFGGTALALLLSQNLFWVYGILTLISVLSLIFAVRKSKFLT